jgi:hypothetical protein
MQKITQKKIWAKKLQAISYKLKAEQRGVALLFAVLLTSMLLLVAIGISNIAYKELLFSGEARDSDRAFFAADTGVECALFLDKIAPNTVFQDPTSPTVGSGTCNTITFSTPTGTITGPAMPDSATYSFMIPISLSKTCVDVTVDKAMPDPMLVPGVTYTKISSVGYNLYPLTGATSCTAGVTGSIRIVSRALTTKYKNP